MKKAFTLKHSVNQGFTLIELLLYLGIFTMMISAIVPFAWMVINTGQKSAVEQEVFNNARYISEKLKKQIRDAKSVNAASNFDSNLVLYPTYKITLNMPGSAPATVISVVNGQVMLTADGNPAVALNSTGTKVTDLTFTNYSSNDGKADNIGFTITMTGAAANNSKVFQSTTQLKESIEMRN